jgi:hypothetical protein
MNHELSSRALTPEEAAFLTRREGGGMKAWADDVFLFIFVAGGLTVFGIFCGFAVGWLTTQIGLEGVARVLFFAILSVFALAGAHDGFTTVRHSRRSRRLAMRDIKTQVVELLRVEGARLVQLEEHNDEGPFYFFDIGRGKVLYLGGQWLLDYGSEAGERPFPSSSFTVHMLASGPVLSIEPTGAELEPEAVLGRKTQLPTWMPDTFKKGFAGDSLILDGDFEELFSVGRVGTQY